jgi:hypothetical protein
VWNVPYRPEKGIRTVELSLPLPISRLAEEDEYLTNSQTINNVIGTYRFYVNGKFTFF